MAKKSHSRPYAPPPLQPQAPRVGKPELGDAYTFTPEAFIGEVKGRLPGQQEIPRRVTGTVTYINEPHRWFRVEYDLHGYHMSECFKF